MQCLMWSAVHLALDSVRPEDMIDQQSLRERTTGFSEKPQKNLPT